VTNCTLLKEIFHIEEEEEEISHSLMGENQERFSPISFNYMRKTKFFGRILKFVNMLRIIITTCCQGVKEPIK